MKSDHCDILVIGHGMAGCVAGALLAESGRDVTIVGRGTTATELSSARVVLPPGEEGAKVADLLTRWGRDHGLYTSPSGRRGAITSTGTMIYQDLTSPHDWTQDREGITAVIGLRGNNDLDPEVVCRSLARDDDAPLCRPLYLGVDIPPAVMAESSHGEEVVDIISEILSEVGEENAVLPPLFVGPHYVRALDNVERRSGRRVLEAATPSSNPGRRLQACLEYNTTASGCRLWKGREVVDLDIANGVVTTATIRSGVRDLRVGVSAIVLAAGGLVGGGLIARGREVVSTLPPFAVDRAPTSPLRSHKLSQALSIGIRNQQGRAELASGEILGNVIVAGSALPGLSFPLGHGLGPVTASAIAAADLGRVR